MKSVRIVVCLAVVVLALATAVHAADFILTGNQLLDVTTSYVNGYLYDYSLANILKGGNVSNPKAYDSSTVNMSDGYSSNLKAYNSSTVNMSGGNIGSYLQASDSSTVNMSGGSIDSWLQAYNSSTVNMSGGNIGGYLQASDSSTVNMSGGNIGGLHVYHSSTIIFDGYDFTLGSGLSWDVDGKTILGTGTLTGKWFDDTSFVIPIGTNATTATIMAIPEPATVLLLTLGGMALLKRKRIVNK